MKNGRLNKLVAATIGMLGVRILGCASEHGTLQEFTYLHEQVTEISNPDESYLGTLNLFFTLSYQSWE